MVLALALVLTGCGREALPAKPALWHVAGRNGEEAWLFGTIHASPAPLAWRTPKVAQALSRSGAIVVEVANLADGRAVAQAFNSLSRTPGLPPATQRVAPSQRRALGVMLAERAMGDGRDFEIWALALTLARPPEGDNSRNGVDRAVLSSAAGKPVVELEGAAAQLAIFDRLPESEQHDLLAAVLADADALDDEADLVDTWRKGDMARIEAETRTGLLADPELRTALFTRRNRQWVQRISGEIHARRRPFVAVGAAHMVGSDGLIAMLQHAGYRIDRVQ